MTTDSITVRVPHPLYERLEERAKLTQRSVEELSLVAKSVGNRMREWTEVPIGGASDQEHGAYFAHSRVGERAAVG